jgi:hypothetical protein
MFYRVNYLYALHLIDHSSHLSIWFSVDAT